MQDTVGCLLQLLQRISVSTVTLAFVSLLSPPRWCEPHKFCHVARIVFMLVLFIGFKRRCENWVWAYWKWRAGGVNSDSGGERMSVLICMQKKFGLQIHWCLFYMRYVPSFCRLTLLRWRLSSLGCLAPSHQSWLESEPVWRNAGTSAASRASRAHRLSRWHFWDTEETTGRQGDTGTWRKL